MAAKARLALESCGAKSVIFGGGVANNQRLRELIAERLPGIPAYWPERELTLDNAAMIGGLAYPQYLRRGGDSWDLEPQTRIEGF